MNQMLPVHPVTFPMLQLSASAFQTLVGPALDDPGGQDVAAFCNALGEGDETLVVLPRRTFERWHAAYEQMRGMLEEDRLALQEALKA